MERAFLKPILGSFRSCIVKEIPMTKNQDLCSPCLTLLPCSFPEQVQYFYQLKFKKMSKIYLALLLLLGIHLAHAKLYHVVAVISEGARYHVNDLYDGAQTKSKWGEQTPVGLRQQETLGKLFKKEFTQSKQLLSQNYVKDQVVVYTTTISSTIQSALANLYGMYPLGTGQALNPAEEKYRIPPYSQKQDVDEESFALPQGQLVQPITYSSALVEDCPNEDNLVEQNINHQLTTYKEMILTYTPFLNKMATIFKIDPVSMNFTKLHSLYDTIRVDRNLGRSLPSDFTEEDLENIEHLYNWYNHFTRSFDLAKAFSTFSFNQAINHFAEKVKNLSSASKWVTISTFEGDLVSIHNMLNISSADCIEELYRKGSTTALNCEGRTPFSSNILFELHSDNETDFYVMVRNNGKYVNLCQEKKTSCDYATFIARLKAAAAPKPQQICGYSKSSLPLATTE